MSEKTPSSLRLMPGTVWALGFVSMLMDISSEMIHALLPLYMVGVLGVSALAVGVIEGIAEAAASITKVFSGALSDYLGRRKLLAAIGYGMAAFTKPVFALASSLDWLIAARFVDRVGKGVRGAPRDALIADVTPPALRGAAYGLRQALDTVGAFAGPLVAVGLMLATADDYVLVFWIAVVPACASFGLIVFAVKEPARAPAAPAAPRLKLTDFVRLPLAFWLVVTVGSIITLARFSEAFLLLRAQSIGVQIAYIPAVMVLMNVAYAASAYPAGWLSDRVDRRAVLAGGLALLIAADAFLAGFDDVFGLAVGVLLWGLHMGLTQGVLATLIADASPAALRGTAFGIFNLVTGLMLLMASVLAGILWDWQGPAATFVAGGIFAAVALATLALIRKARPNG